MEKIISIYNNEKYLKLIKDCKKSFITQDKDDKFIYTYIEILYIHVNKLLNNSDDYQKLTDIKNKINTITCLLLILSFFYNNNFLVNGEAHTKDFDIYNSIINILKLLKDTNLEKIRELLINLNNNDKIKNILNDPKLQITSDIKTDVFNEDFIKNLKKIVLPDDASAGGADGSGADGSGADGSGADGLSSNASSVVTDGSGADTITTDTTTEVESINESNEMERIKIIFQIKIMHDLFMLSNEDIDIIKKLSLN
jgi:hypothetical protein